MTLVVARNLADGPHLVCDSQLTDPTGRNLNPYSDGALKLVILHRGLCVGYDGGDYTGRRAILKIAAGLGTGSDLGEVRRILTKASRAGANGFVLAALAPAPVLMRIRGGVVEDGRAGAWLGDQPAFDAFQRRLASAGSLRHELQHDRLNHLQPAERDIAARMLPAMMQVIEDPRFPGVGGMPICVGPSASGFRYESVAMLATGPQGVQDDEEDWTEPEWGTAAEGGFGYAVKVPGVAGVGAIGAYFPHGRLGVLYFPAQSERPICIADVDDVGFCTAVEEQFGFSFDRRGLGFPPTGSGVPPLEVGA